MNGKFTQRAQKVIAYAQEEARRLNHNVVGTEHLLLGLIREGEGVAARALANLGIDVSKVRSQVEAMIGAGPFPIQVPSVIHLGQKGLWSWPWMSPGSWATIMWARSTFCSA